MFWIVTPPAPPVTPPVVLRPFAPAVHAWLPAHRGVDLQARRGQAVVAPRHGKVVFAAQIAGRPVMVVKSKSVRFTLEPVRALVSVGTRVSPQQRIGRVGRGGHCDQRCLHWGAKVDGEYVDPLAFLPSRRPVLKPVGAGRG
jgi:murein DD-endopeptidase MepM/ murein hydrolase activator NlpD